MHDKQTEKENNKIRKVFLDELPKKNSKINRKSGRNIDWNNSIGYEVHFIYDDIEGDLKIIEHIKDVHPKLRIKYNNKESIIDVRELIDCYLGRMLNIRTFDFKAEIGQVFKDEKRDITVIDREIRIDVKGRRYKYYRYYCNACKYDEGWVRENNLFNEQTCQKCSDGISYPNKFMFNILEQLDIYFKPEYSPKWIGRKRYDFYIPSLNTIIEMDGGFHNKDNNMTGQSAEESKFIDDEKDEQAKLHGIEVIRIDCDYKDISKRYEYIKNNILTNMLLNKTLYLSHIKWDDCNKFALSSRVKEACNLWAMEIYNEKEIADIMKTHVCTINIYLKQGSEFNWCNYEAKRKINT